MPAVGYRTGKKLLDAIRACRTEAADLHDKFRLLADLVQNPVRTLAAVQEQPMRVVMTPSAAALGHPITDADHP